MADFETIRSVSGARASQIDEGLRAHMNKVYGTMSVGMIITALAAYAISGLATTSDPALAVGQMQNGTMLTGLGATIYTSPLRWVIMFAPLLMIFGFGAVMRRSTAQAAQLFFYVFATLIGVSLSSIFILYAIYKFYEAKKKGNKMSNETKARNRRTIFRFIQGVLVGSIVTVVIFYSLTYKEHERMHNLLEEHGIEEHKH